jgi:hypothetical protein
MVACTVKVSLAFLLVLRGTSILAGCPLRPSERLEDGTAVSALEAATGENAGPT